MDGTCSSKDCTGIHDVKDPRCCAAFRTAVTARREAIQRLRARGIVHIEDATPFHVLAVKLLSIEEEREEERNLDAEQWWPPAFVKRRPVLIAPIVVIPWIIVFALMAANPSFRLPVISTVILAVYSARLIRHTLDRCDARSGVP